MTDPDHSERQSGDHRSLTAKIADELRHNDECGSREPMLDDEYMDDAAAILRIVREHRETKWNEIVRSNQDATMERWRLEIVRLRNWIDTEGRNCPGAASIDAVLDESLRAAG